MPQTSLPQKARDFLNRHVLDQKPERRARKAEAWIGRLPPDSPTAVQLRADLKTANNAPRPYQALKAVKEAAKAAAATYAGNLKPADVEKAVVELETQAARFRVAKENVPGIEAKMLVITDEIKKTAAPPLQPTGEEHREETNRRDAWRTRMTKLSADWQRAIDICAAANPGPSYRKLCVDLEVLESDPNPAIPCEALRDRARLASAAFQRGHDFLAADAMQRELATQQQRFESLLGARVMGPVFVPPFLKTKPLGDECDGEAQGQGWRASAEPPKGGVRHALWALTKDAPVQTVTGHWDDKQRSEHVVNVDATTGAVSTPDGGSGDSYVVDPQGKAYVFDGADQGQRKLTPEAIEGLKAKLERVRALESECAKQRAQAGISDEQLAAAKELPGLRAKLQSCDADRNHKLALIQVILNKLEELNAAPKDGYFSDVPKALTDSEIELKQARAALLSTDTDKAKTTKQISELEQKLLGVDASVLAEAVADHEALGRTKRSLESSIASGTVQTMTHHSSPLEGADVSGAGELKRDVQGRITEISNVSGRYEPQFVHLEQTIEVLMREGALLDKTLTYIDDQGQVAELSKNPRLDALYREVQDKLPSLPGLKARAQPATQQLAKLPTGLSPEALETLRQKLQQECDDLGAQVEAIQKALHMLRKLGVGPANRTADAKVVFMDDIQNKTGKHSDPGVAIRTGSRRSKVPTLEGRVVQPNIATMRAHDQ